MGQSSASTKFNLVDHFGDFTAAMRGGFPFLDEGLSDMDIVLIATAMIDKALQFTLTVGFYKGAVSNALMERVFKGTGPLSTFSAKIDLAHIQGLTDPDEHHDLRVLRKVRNEFAHTFAPLRLADMASCDNLKLRSEQLEIKRKSKREANFLHSSSALVSRSMLGAVSLLAKQQIVLENRERFLTISEELLAQIYGDPRNILGDALS